jgi:gas vesicle protein
MAEDTKVGERAVYFLLGGLIGAAVALLLAPHSGEETRKMISNKAREGSDYITQRSKEVSDKAGGVIEKGKELLQHQRDQLSAALDAGKQAYQEEKDKSKV